MPSLARRRKRKTKKRTYRRRNTFTSISRSTPLGFPKVKHVKMRYVEAWNFLPIAGSMIKHNFRLNGIYDPRVATGGHQPYGHDQWLVFYNHYVVSKSKITVTFVPQDKTTNTTPMVCGVYLDDDNTNSTVWGDLLETGQSSQQILQPSDISKSTQSLSYDAKRFYNITDLKDNFDRLGASMGVDPGEQAIAVVYVQPLDYASGGSVTARIVIDYDVILSEPKEMPAS